MFFQISNNNLFKNAKYNLLWCDGKTGFSASLLQSSVSHDPSEIILICWYFVGFFEYKVANVLTVTFDQFNSDWIIKTT